ncbi:class I SAM-dependent methyltransferase [Patescibacteria group bacterium]|nr:class I SAM-dependent methyltransferase [Patescibacteria group bacterium]
MNKTTKDNEKKWDKLVLSDVPCGRPKIDLTPKKAKAMLDKDGILGKIKNKKVLCLASGGGQQSIGFALLGAKVTVTDFSLEQLKQDKLASEKFSKDIRIIKSDMRDLSMFKNNEFDIVYQPYSINYVPKTDKVFDEVSRVLKKGGIYHLMFHNPFVQGSWKDGCWGSKWNKKELWKGKGYPIWQPYKDGYKSKTTDPSWNFVNKEGKVVKRKGPQEFKHTLSTVLNGLVQRGFKLIQMDEHTQNNYKSVPGTWEHYISVAPPWLFLWIMKEK